jgi:hypothetical protein
MHDMMTPPSSALTASQQTVVGGRRTNCHSQRPNSDQHLGVYDIGISYLVAFVGRLYGAAF